MYIYTHTPRYAPTQRPHIPLYIHLIKYISLRTHTSICSRPTPTAALKSTNQLLFWLSRLPTKHVVTYTVLGAVLFVLFMLLLLLLLITLPLPMLIQLPLPIPHTPTPTPKPIQPPSSSCSCSSSQPKAPIFFLSITSPSSQPLPPMLLRNISNSHTPLFFLRLGRRGGLTGIGRLVLLCGVLCEVLFL